MKTLEVLKSVFEVIRLKKEIPSGELYALFLPLGLENYNAVINFAIKIGLVTIKHDLIKWVEPNIEE